MVLIPPKTGKDANLYLGGMEWLDRLSIEPIQFVYGAIAICGGVARYLSGYKAGKPFMVGIFLASAFVAGFSGWMFALMGEALNMPEGVTFIMAGTGGFMGEQTMKLIVEWIQGRVK